jgi:hypothetical protein
MGFGIHIYPVNTVGSPRNCSHDGPMSGPVSGPGKSSMHDFLGHNSGHVRVNTTLDRPPDTCS